MLTSSKLTETVHTVPGGIGLANSGGVTGRRVSLANAARCVVRVSLKPASGTDTAAITLEQSKTVDDSPSSEKTLAFTAALRTRPATDDVPVAITVSGNSVTTSATALEEEYAIEINASDLDIANGFDCIRASVSDPGSVSTPTHIAYDLYGNRFSGTFPSAFVD